MSNGETSNDSNVEMKSRLALGLAVYLVGCTLFAAYSVYTLWALHGPRRVPAIAQQNGQTQGASTKTGADASKTDNGSAAANASQTNPKTGAADKQPGTQTGSGGADQKADTKAGQNSDKQADKENTGTQTQGDGKVGPPGVGGDEKYDLIFSWTWAWWGPKDITADTRLLLLVLLMGAFGSAVYSLKGLADYRGEDKLKRSWALFYFIQPFEGSGIAVLMYLVVRGGFLSGTTTDVNVFGTCAIAGLAGAFSDTAFMKLNEVFNTLFKPQDTRSGKLSDPTSDTTSNQASDQTSKFAVSTPSPLPDGTVGQAYKVTLKADNGTGTLAWTVTPALPAGLALGAATGVLIGTPSAAHAATDYTFTVKDSSTPPATATKSLSLTIH
jgi:Putative Ig domain